MHRRSYMTCKVNCRRRNKSIFTTLHQLLQIFTVYLVEIRKSGNPGRKSEIKSEIRKSGPEIRNQIGNPEIGNQIGLCDWCRCQLAVSFTAVFSFIAVVGIPGCEVWCMTSCTFIISYDQLKQFVWVLSCEFVFLLV